MVFLKILQISQENTCVVVYFLLIKFQALPVMEFILKKTCTGCIIYYIKKISEKYPKFFSE